MSKKIILIVLLCFLPFSSFAQLDPFIQFQQYIETVELVRTSIKQLQKANDMVRYQVMAMEKLGEGDVDALIEAFDMQTRAVSEYTDFVTGFDYLDEYERFEDSFNSGEWEEMESSAQRLDSYMRATNNMLLDTQNLIHNTEARIDGMEQLNAKSLKTESLTGQLQLNNQALSMMNGELTDIKIVMLAAAQREAVKAKNEELAEQMRLKRQKEFIEGEGVLDKNPSTTDQERKDLFLGRDYTKDWY